MLGKIVYIHPFIRRGRLRVRLIVNVKTKGYHEAFLGEREIAALLPRSILLPSVRNVPASLLGIIGAILRKMTVGRIARLKENQEETVVSFLSWQNIRFHRNPKERSSNKPSESRRRPPH